LLVAELAGSAPPLLDYTKSSELTLLTDLLTGISIQDITENDYRYVDLGGADDRSIY